MKTITKKKKQTQKNKTKKPPKTLNWKNLSSGAMIWWYGEDMQVQVIVEEFPERPLVPLSKM